jgi:hypothetical protein
MELKDARVQTVTSFAAYNVALVYITLDAINDPSEWLDAYPKIEEDASYASHIWFFIRTVLKLQIWGLVVLYVVFAVLLASKYLLVDLVLKDGSDLSAKDVHSLLTRYIWSSSSYAWRILAGHAIVAAVFALFVVTQDSMQYESARLNTMRILMSTLLGVQVIVFAGSSPTLLAGGASSSGPTSSSSDSAED